MCTCVYYHTDSLGEFLRPLPPLRVLGGEFCGLSPEQVMDQHADSPAPPDGSPDHRTDAPPAHPYVPLSYAELEPLAEARHDWLWQGYLLPGAVTLLTSLWKSGKTTLLAVLLA